MQAAVPVVAAAALPRGPKPRCPRAVVATSSPIAPACRHPADCSAGRRERVGALPLGAPQLLPLLRLVAQQLRRKLRKSSRPRIVHIFAEPRSAP